jgi:hypothetical protein
MSAHLFNEFQQIVQRMQGLPCWNVQAGAIGSLVNLHLGERIPLQQPLPFPNPQLSEEAHRYRGEIVLYIEDCPWRLDGADRVLASWLDSNVPTGPIVSEMTRLVGQQVTEVALTRPSLDLALTFDSGSVLRVFPDQVDPNEGDNYSVSLPEKTFIVAARSTLYLDE